MEPWANVGVIWTPIGRVEPEFWIRWYVGGFGPTGELNAISGLRLRPSMAVTRMPSPKSEPSLAAIP